MNAKATFNNSLLVSATFILSLVAANCAEPGYWVVHDFSGDDGAYPEARLLVSGTTLYGTTCGGGLSNVGTVFQLQTDGSGYSVLHHFTSFPDGANPQAGLALSGDALYGTTCGGGVANSLCVTPTAKEGAPCGTGMLDGGGTVFKINTDASGYAVLHRFLGPFLPYPTNQDGLTPQTPVTISGGVIYGTTYQGGHAYCPGAIFRMDVDGNESSVLRGGIDPWFPGGGLTLSDSILYGTTCSGGIHTNTGYGGMVFKINPDGSSFSVLKAFVDGSDGAAPYGELVLAGTTLYGTTSGDGAGHTGDGTIFKLNTDGSGYAVLKNFTGTDGASARAGLLLIGSTLYGTTSKGGTFGQGNIFKIDLDGSNFAVLKNFSGGNDGGKPFGELVFAGQALYGTASAGGANGKGVIFSLALSPPFVVTPPGSQTAELGTSAAFAVQADGTPPLAYQWLFNGTNIINDLTIKPLLTLTNLRYSDSGAYSVMVTNPFGAVTSSPALLSVIAPVQKRSVPALAMTGDVGSSVNLEFTPALGPSASWSALETVVLTNPPQFYFEMAQPLFEQGFYRVWQSGPVGALPVLNASLVPAITLTGVPGSSVRLDYINALGPIDAWATLDTIALTNSSQIYFDVSAPGKPLRLYRIVPVP